MDEPSGMLPLLVAFSQHQAPVNTVEINNCVFGGPYELT